MFTVRQFLLLLILSPLALAFSFTFEQTSLTQCETVNVQWQGGSPPFYMTIMVSDLWAVSLFGFTEVSTLILSLHARPTESPICVSADSNSLPWITHLISVSLIPHGILAPRQDLMPGLSTVSLGVRPGCRFMLM
jgi:hypothetical protein